MDCSFVRRSLIGCIEWTFFLKYYFPLFGAGLTSLQTVMWWWRPSDEMTHASSTFYQRTWYFLRLYTQNVSNLHWGLDRESFLPIQAVEVLRLWITTCSGPFFTFKSEKLLLHSTRCHFKLCSDWSVCGSYGSHIVRICDTVKVSSSESDDAVTQ